MKKALLTVLALCACVPSVSPEATTSAPSAPEFGTVSLGGKTWNAEIARTEQQRLAGFMNRQNMPAGTAMLFIFDVADDWSMWMKDTLVPLDMIFMNSDGFVTGVALERTPLSEDHITPCGVEYEIKTKAGGVDVDEFFDSCEPAFANGAQKATKYVLEVLAGEASDVKVGDSMTFRAGLQ